TAKRHQYPHPDLDYRNELLRYRIRKGSFQVERQNDLGKIQNQAAINRTYKSSKINAEHNPAINEPQLRCLIARGIMVVPRVTAAIIKLQTHRTNFSIPFFRRLISLSINISSRPVCPATEVFSCALLVRYGTTSFTGPYGRYLEALYFFSPR